MPDIEHSTLSGSELHEPKGIEGATANEVYVANGSNSGSWQSMVLYGWEDINNAGSSQALTSGVPLDLENDGAGAFSRSDYALPGSTGIWDTTNHAFDWAAGGCEVGDIVIVRFDIDVTVNSSNDNVLLALDMSHGTGSEFQIPVDDRNIDLTGTERLVRQINLYIGDTTVLNNPAKVSLTANTAGDSVLVNGWFVQVFKRNPVFV